MFTCAIKRPRGANDLRYSESSAAHWRRKDKEHKVRIGIARIGLVAALLVTGQAWGQQIEKINTLSQGEFRLLSEDLGAALSYRPQTPTEPLGITGFDLGIAVTAAKIQHQDILTKASSETVGSTLTIPTLRVHKGLPFGFDIGVMYASVPGSNIKFYGGELRYAIIEGGVAMPAVGLRGSVSKLSGVDQLSVDTRGFDLSISKGFAFLTPYAGIGRVRADSDPKGVPTLHSESVSYGKTFVGLGIKLALLNFNFEADKTGDVKAYSLKIGIRF